MKMTEFPFDSVRLIDICKENDVNYVGLFGSMARGDGNRQSDIDLLVRFSGRKSLLALVHLERELTQCYGAQSGCTDRGILKSIFKRKHQT